MRIPSQNSKPWTQVREVKIAHRSFESVNEILRMAADRLAEYVNETNPDDANTKQLIKELDELRKDLH